MFFCFCAGRGKSVYDFGRFIGKEQQNIDYHTDFHNFKFNKKQEKFFLKKNEKPQKTITIFTE